MAENPVVVITFRRASPEDAEELTALTIASKSHWGYDQEFMDRARPSLMVTRDYIEANDCWVAEAGGGTIGWFSLVNRPDALLLDNFFLSPTRIGSGVGRLMWRRALNRAKTLGAERVVLEADPNAAGFYERMGARLTGSVRIPSTNRELPVYEVHLAGGEPPH
jgi:GNAT superfamily N-acetyltransferase